jgi:hypothetical protein
MSGTPRAREPQMRQCNHCGKQIRRGLAQCPYCRETQSEYRRTTPPPQPARTSGHFRNGLLLMLLSAAAHYFAAGYSPLTQPNEITPLLTFLTPALFVGGLFFSLWGFFQRMRA